MSTPRFPELRMVIPQHVVSGTDLFDYTFRFLLDAGAPGNELGEFVEDMMPRLTPSHPRSIPNYSDALDIVRHWVRVA